MRPRVLPVSVFRWLACCCALLSVIGGSAEAADLFYSRLVEDGIRAFDRGDFQTAAEDLKLGCFGLLEEPDNLARCLTYLAVAQGEIADVPAFTRTFDRILEVERMFQAFSKLAPGTVPRASLETHVENLVPYETLARSPVFRDVARRRKEAEIRAMAPEERRAELTKRIAAEPAQWTWRLMMADMDLASGDFESALVASEAVLEREPRLQWAICTRGAARAGLGLCEAALLDLDLCEEPESRSRRMAMKLRCHIELQAWADADQLLSELSPEELQAAPFRQLARELRKERRVAGSSPAPTPPAGEESPEPAATTARVPGGEATPSARDSSTPAGPSAVSGRAPVDAEAEKIRGELDGLRQVLRRGSRSELEEAFSEARRLADSKPGIAELQLLTAEIAYRLSSWQQAVSYFERGGVRGTSRPELQFYLAVSLYESGDQTAAQEILRRCLPQLEPSDFVRSYAARINGSER